MCPHPTKLFLIEGDRGQFPGGTFFSKPWENFQNPKYTPNSYKKESFGKNVPPHQKLSKEAILSKKSLK
jgi:hypothetical protein